MKPIAILILLLLVSLDLFGQSIYNLNRYEPEIIDGRAEALGRTSILSSNGANNVFNNPALLSELTSTDLQFSIRATFGNINKLHTATDTTSVVDNYSDTDYKRTIHPKINGLSFGIPYQISPISAWNFGFAAGYRTYYDWGYDIHEKRKEVISDEITNEEEDNEFNGGFNTLVIGGGINYKKKFYAGVSISIPFNSKYSNIYEDFDGNKAKNSGTASGTFYTISGSYILNNYVTIGTRVKTEYKLEIDGSDDQFNITYHYCPVINQTIPIG